MRYKFAITLLTASPRAVLVGVRRYSLLMRKVTEKLLLPRAYARNLACSRKYRTVVVEGGPGRGKITM